MVQIYIKILRFIFIFSQCETVKSFYNVNKFYTRPTDRNII